MGIRRREAGPGEGPRWAGTPAARAGFGVGLRFARRIPKGRIAAATAAAGGAGVIHGPPETVTGPR